MATRTPPEGQDTASGSSAPAPFVRLKRGREKALRNGHPWIFSGAVAKQPRGIEPGGVVEVLSDSGQWLARGAINPGSSLLVRVLTRKKGEQVDEGLVRRRVEAAVARRPGWVGRRLVHMEADRLPGLIVDQYASIVVMQVLTPFAERHRDVIVEALRACLSPTTIYERSDSAARRREGLAEREGLLWGEPPPPLVEVEEEGGVMLVDVVGGQKTGFFLDQRLNRWRAADHMAGRRVLNAFSYTGGFAVAAMARGAQSVVNVDVSEEALGVAAKAAALGGVSDKVECVKADVFKDLRARLSAKERWGAIVLDPPKFAQGKASLKRACRGYKDINMQAMRLMEPGGVLATFSCSGLVTPTLFRQVVAGAAADSGRRVTLLEKLTQPEDHPIDMCFPESEYLKGLILRVD